MINNMKKSIIDELFNDAIHSEKVAKGKIVAAIVYKNAIVAKASNTKKTHPFQKKYGKNSDAICLHAETNAAIRAMKAINLDDMARSDLYIARAKRESIGGKYIMGMAKPCVGCQRMIASLSIRNVYYTTDDGKIENL